MTARSLLIATIAAFALVGQAAAQDVGGSRRLDQLEKQVRELRAIVFQGRDTGQPVEVRPAGPDPAVTALEQRFDGVDETIRQIKGQSEELTHETEESRQSVAAMHDQNGQLQAQLKDLGDRVARLEAQLAPSAGAGAPPPPPPSNIPPPPVDATAAAQAADTGRLGGPSSAPGAPPATAATASDAYRAARAQLTAGDYAGAANGFQDYLTRYPSAKNTPEAYYWLGESDYAREDYQDATPAYARALKGWPKLPWSPDATVKLARALAETNRTPEACAALAEFDHRYHTVASPTVKARAEAVRSRAKCGA
ncbi:tol-pal system protein YbgF [Caulobacter sp. S45]|uniref:tol-pal system protein YbgF n=1 Tax=Caulobacter sp. S45 TaxID=1641861 RepID=UPI00157683F6|nr:tol-pal system protein YbgF [Caulobacter sp. S45]